MTDFEYETFAKICECIIDLKWKSILRIFIDKFTIGEQEHEYIVVEYVGGAITVRNANINSFVANLFELSQLLYGGYYEEVEQYKKLKAQKGETHEQ